VQLLVALEEHKHPSIVSEVERFLEDVNEPARFHAVATTLAQDDAAALPALVTCSRRRRERARAHRIAEGLAFTVGWFLPDRSATLRGGRYQPPFSIDGAGHVVKSGGAVDPIR
jgi:hypothetical protein